MLKTAYSAKQALHVSDSVRDTNWINGTGQARKSQQHVMLVSNSTWGLYNFRLPLIRMLLEQYDCVTIVSPEDEYTEIFSKIDGLKVIRLRSLDRNSLDIFSNMFLFTELFRIYRKQQPDIILHFSIKPNIFGNLAAAALKTPSICVVAGLGYTYLHKGWLQSLTSLLYRFSFLFAQNVIFENPSDRELMVNKKITQHAKTLVTPGCGIDTSHFKPTLQFAVKRNTIFTFIGRLLTDKGLVEFVKAAQIVKSRVTNVEFWILGEIDEGNPAHINKEMLQEWSRQGFIKYKGVTKDVRPFLAQSDWIVLPSYREGMSRVLLEAMAMGKPLITTDTAGCREAVEVGKNGYLVPVKDVQTLAQTIEYCNTLPIHKVIQMGMYGRKKVVEEFELELVVKTYLNLVDEIL